MNKLLEPPYAIMINVPEAFFKHKGKIEGDREEAFRRFYENMGPGGCFTIEQFRSWCKIEKKFEAPNSKRAFGGVVLKAAKEKLIFKDGYAQTESPTAHGAIAALWRIPQTKLLAA